MRIGWRGVRVLEWCIKFWIPYSKVGGGVKPLVRSKTSTFWLQVDFECQLVGNLNLSFCKVQRFCKIWFSFNWKWGENLLQSKPVRLYSTCQDSSTGQLKSTKWLLFWQWPSNDSGKPVGFFGVFLIILFLKPELPSILKFQEVNMHLVLSTS